MEQGALQQEYENLKKKAKWGCLIWVVILFIGPLLLIVGKFYYEMEIKERVLVVSQSPNHENPITIAEKGEPAWFGPSSIRIKFGWKHIDRMVSNDGKMLQDLNAVVRWENDYEAMITIYGEEQSPECIKFNAKDSKPFEVGEFEGVESEKDLGSFTFKTSESPNLINIIEFREVSKVNGASTVKIFYGERGSIVENFKEYFPTDMYTPENFNVNWKNDEQVIIEVIRQNEIEETYIEETIEIDLSK